MRVKSITDLSNNAVLHQSRSDKYTNNLEVQDRPMHPRFMIPAFAVLLLTEDFFGYGGICSERPEQTTWICRPCRPPLFSYTLSSRLFFFFFFFCLQPTIWKSHFCVLLKTLTLACIYILVSVFFLLLALKWHGQIQQTTNWWIFLLHVKIGFTFNADMPSCLSRQYALMSNPIFWEK